MPELARAGEVVFHGIPVSAGVCRGRILVLNRAHLALPEAGITEEQVPDELKRLERALIRTRQQLVQIQSRVSAAMDSQDALIFDAHLLVLEDDTLLSEVNRAIQQKHLNAEQAFARVSEKFAATLASMSDEYLRERASDLRDVVSRVLNNLQGKSEYEVLQNLSEPSIIVSHDLAPSATASLDKRFALGFATDSGSQTSHTAILARSLRIPAVVGLHNASSQMANGQSAVLDGYNGLLIINPTDQTLFEYGQLVRRQADLQEKLSHIHDDPAITLDGRRVILSANVEQPSDTDAVLASGAEGVGLFRTEYLYINRETLPSEDEQYQAYRQIASRLQPQPVIIRTLDLGGDKFLRSSQNPQESNPFLGWRAIRICLHERHMFRSHLRAILRASVEGNIQMMYPMISGLEELTQANNLVEEYKQELRQEGVPFNENLEIGAMIEIPSAVMVADALAKRVRFFSLGTNDLIQYSLAVDRLNERIAHLYEPTHPAIVRLIKTTVDAGHAHGLWVGVCGEMAGDPSLVPLLVGLGVDELSAAPPLVPGVKFLIRRLKLTEAEDLAAFALHCESSAEILERSQMLARQAAPSLFDED
jgi:phosphotransferase system enzyme I (PtsI)